MGPLTAAELLWFWPGRKASLPWVGLSPKTELKDAGIRMLPPPSLPSEMGRSPAAMA
jgi:hypothetical protein